MIGRKQRGAAKAELGLGRSTGSAEAKASSESSERSLTLSAPTVSHQLTSRMLARRAGIDLNDGHALLAAIVSALAHPRPATGAPLSSARRAAANPSRAISHRSYSTTTAIASSIPSRTRSSAPEQAHADEARRRFCDLAVRERLAEGRDAGYEGPIASTSGEFRFILVFTVS